MLLSGTALAATVNNTASVGYNGPQGAVVIESNTVSVQTVPPPSPSSLTFYQYAPGVTGADTFTVEGGEYYDAVSGSFQPLAAPTAVDGSAIDLSSPVEVRETQVFHAGEPVFIVLTDANRNLDPAEREIIELRVTTSNGDTELLRLVETGPDTGVFIAVIMTVDAARAGITPNDGRLSLGVETGFTVDYQDAYYPFDTSLDSALVDPFGEVFDSATGQPVDGAIVTMINVDTGLPATVFGDDGISTYPATVTSGGATVDSSGFPYSFPPGGFRFPFVAPGNYRFDVQPPPGYTAPSSVAADSLPPDPDGVPYTIAPGSYGDVFVVLPGPALHIDFPVDPPRSTLLLQKAVSQSEASVGDFLQYRLTLQNIDAVYAVNAIDITDRLPFGMAYQPGSLRLDGKPVADPAIAADRRTLTMPVGSLAPGAALQVTYVLMAGAGLPAGEAVNEAVAVGTAGLAAAAAARSVAPAAAASVQSNVARAAVQIREPFFTDAFTLIGRVTEGDCRVPWAERKGVPDVRILLEDGTYTVTDADGQYHIEGVSPGTHVVQMDVDSLPPVLQPVSCIDNTRFAGTPWSQFVDVKGGSLWRADFQVAPRSTVVGLRPGVQVESEPLPQATERVAIREVKTVNLLAEFDSCRATLQPAGEADVERLVAQLRNEEIARIEVIGHTDNQRLSARCRQLFADNHVLSEARARTVGDLLAAGLALDAAQIEIRGAGPDQPLASNATAAGQARNRRTEVRFHIRETVGYAEATAAGETDAPAADAPRRIVRMHNHIALDGSGPVRNLNLMVLLPPGHAYVPSSAQFADGTAVPARVEGEVLMLAPGDIADAGAWQRQILFTVQPSAGAAMANCNAQAYDVKAVLNAEAAGGRRVQTPATTVQARCSADDAAAVTGERQEMALETVVDKRVDPAIQARRAQRAAIPDSATAAGANTDWLADGRRDIGQVFPPAGYNPRSPATRIVVRHAPRQTVQLRDAQGEPVSALAFDGVTINAAETAAVSVWRGVPLVEGNNRFTAEVRDVDGNIVKTLPIDVAYGGVPVRAELVPEQSVLVADGINRPVLAVRLRDRDGNPVRHGLTGSFTVNLPFQAWEQVERQQNRQLAGMDRFQPGWHVEGDDGIAYIELAPTTETGAVVLGFNFQTGNGTGAGGQAGLAGGNRSQEIRAWMEPAPRDWILVGFAEGTVGYRTLKDNIQPLLDEGVDDGTWHDGQFSLYAKGRVRGEWLMTMAFDSDKGDARERQKALLSQIDPDEYYTLYGDGSGQGHDAPSQDRLYLKLERGQFYAMFGDYETGLTQTQLTRYSRTLNGIKVEDGGGRLAYILFAAETPQDFVRDEIQGDGTSGLYRLTQGGIVLNSERIRIETRDRLQSQSVLETRVLARHLDYDIDYSNGTIFFRQPVPSRDASFNPVIIVAEYETLGVASQELNAGGRVAVALDEGGRAVLGLSSVRDAGGQGTTVLGGADLKVKLAADTELRVEAADSDGRQGVAARDGDAWLAELEHHSGRYNALFYTRRIDTMFGVGQQSGAERGQLKTGLDGQVRLTDTWALQGQLYNQENLATDDTRDAALGMLRYSTTKGGFGVGGQVVQDEAGSGALAGQTFRSEQATVMANRFFLENRLELSAQADSALGGNRDSVDFPNRYLFGAGYAISRQARLLAGQEFTEGRLFDTSTTRVGVQVMPWTGARMESTLNQSEISEYGPRTYGQYGLSQAVLVNDRWGLDFSADASHTFNRSAQQPLVVNPGQPVTPSGTLGAVGVTEDFRAYSAGATYREPLWSWNGRVETRDGEITDRYGLVSSFLRQATAGIAYASSARWFRSEQSTGMEGVLASVDFSLAWRPLGVQWSVLNRLELRHEDVENGNLSGGGLFGNNSLVAANASTRRVINNLAINRVSREWTGEDRTGNLFNRYERNQWSLYYGAKYALDTFDGVDYSGYTDLIGVEVRHDLNPRWDIGVQASSLNAWKPDTHAYSIGPMVGWSPVKNGWVTLGYNLRGFYDADFDAARYTAQGPYLQLRLKFDQTTRLWKKEDDDVSR